MKWQAPQKSYAICIISSLRNNCDYSENKTSFIFSHNLIISYFVEFMIDFTEGFIECVFGLIENEIVSAGISTREASEGFFKASEAGPWVVCRSVIWCDAPEVEEIETFGFSVEDGLAKETDGGGEFFVGGVGGGLHVVAGGVFFVVEEERSSDDLVKVLVGVFKMDEVKGSERLAKFVF